jgi:large subunit ribosomal protein L25
MPEMDGFQVMRALDAGRVPAVVFGHGVESSNVSIDAHEFELFRKHAGANTLLDLVVGKGKATPALIQGVQVHPVSRRPLHIDLLAVQMTEERTVEVPVVATGSSVLLERENGTLSHAIAGVRVRALPDHLPNSIEVSIEGLTAFDQAIHVRDLTIPADVHLLTDPDEVVIRILPPRVETGEAAPAAEGAEEGEAAAASGESASAEGEASAEG